jgi:hypothetical protein
MLLEKQMTNEAIKKHFENNFDLANHAIALAKDHLTKEEELPSLMQILNEVYQEAKKQSAS